MSKTINTYRALKQLKIGDGVRDYGELVPEASDWQNVAVWIREGHIEPTTCSEEEMKAHLKKYGQKPTVKKTKKKTVVKKSAAKKIVIKKKGKPDASAGRKLAEQSV